MVCITYNHFLLRKIVVSYIEREGCVHCDTNPSVIMSYCGIWLFDHVNVLYNGTVTIEQRQILFEGKKDDDDDVKNHIY